MKRSNKALPFWIILTLAIVGTCVVLLKNTSSSILQYYDVLGLNSLKSDDFLYNNEDWEEDEEQPELENQGTENYDPNVEQDPVVPGGTVLENPTVLEPEQTEPEQTEPEQTEPEQTVPNTDASAVTGTPYTDNSEEKAEVATIEFDTAYIRTIDPEQEADKVSFFTVNTESDYRVHLKTKVSDTPLKASFTITLYDEVGKVVEKSKSMQANYSNSNSYRDEFNVDFHLEKSKQYTLKISGGNLSGDYQIAVSPRSRDAGYSKETARSIKVGEEITGEVNSALDDWFVCDVSENGEYTVTFYNIDTGCRMYADGEITDGTRTFWITAQNEDTYTDDFFMRAGEKIFIKVRPERQDVSGTYIMQINKKAAQ